MEYAIRRLRIILIIFFYYALSTYSQQTSVDAGLVISSINFDGVNRTKVSTLKNILYPIDVGKVYSVSTENDIVQKLHKSGLFEPDIKITTITNENFVEINVQLKDRWTLLPLPNFALSESSWMVGLFIVEKNLFGLGKQLSVEGFYSSDYFGGELYYTDHYFLIPNLSMGTGILFEKRSVIDINIKTKETNRAYNNMHLSAEFGVGYKILESLNIESYLIYEWYGYVKNEIGDTKPINAIGLRSKLEYKNTFYQYPFEKGITARLAGSYRIGMFNTDSYFYIKPEFNFATIFANLHRVGGSILGGFGNTPPQKEHHIGGEIAAYTLPKSTLAVDWYGSATVFYEFAMLDLSFRAKEAFATISVIASYEGGILGSDVISNTWYHGPSIGIRLYLIKIASPIVELRYGWDLQNSGVYFKVGIARRF